MPSLPTPFRAAVGLAAQTLDEVRHLPTKAVELPMAVVSTALQLSLRAQQRYAEFAARGDEVLKRTPAGEEPPSWATFDEDKPEIRVLEPDSDEVAGPVAPPNPVTPSKQVRRPRNAEPSPFDTVGDDD